MKRHTITIAVDFDLTGCDDTTVREAISLVRTDLFPEAKRAFEEALTEDSPLKPTVRLTEECVYED